jgi:hypothetical protein
MQQIENVPERELLAYFYDTAQLLSDERSELLSKSSNGLLTSRIAGILTDDVEFWNWMGLNYPNALSTPALIAQNAEKMRKTIQGKSYEWEFMLDCRKQLQNIFSRFDAGTNPTQPGIDITKTNISGDVEYYQLKAYTSNNKPDLSHTPKDAIVITGEENVLYAEGQGYSAHPYKNAIKISQDTDRRMREAATGRNTAYTPLNVMGASLKAGAIGFAIGCSVESFFLYKEYKSGNISKDEYMKSIFAAGGESGVVAGVATCVMIPVNALITGAGLASPITIPISFFVCGTLQKFLAPIFKRGEYKQLLDEAKYYKNLSSLYEDLLVVAESAGDSFRNLVLSFAEQTGKFAELHQQDKVLTSELRNILNSI